MRSSKFLLYGTPPVILICEGDPSSRPAPIALAFLAVVLPTLREKFFFAAGVYERAAVSVKKNPPPPSLPAAGVFVTGGSSPSFPFFKLDPSPF